MRIISLLVQFILASSIWLLGSSALAATPACLSVGADAGQIATVRGQIETQCPCASFDGSPGKGRRPYGRCVRSVIKLAVDGNNLRAICARPVNAAYRTSICGRDPLRHSAPCLQTTASGKFKCTIVATTRADGVALKNRCVSTDSTSAATCSEHENCLDTADRNNDLVVDASDVGDCLPAASHADIRSCCFSQTSNSSCTYNFGSQACDCGSKTYSCLPQPYGASDPPGYPPAVIPARDAPAPVPAPPGSLCDYYYCYSYVAGTLPAEWTAELRVGAAGPPPPPNPPQLVAPADLAIETPFAPVNYCDVYHCYWLSNPILGYWGAILRHGSELTRREVPPPISPTYYCGQNYCYQSDAGVWTPIPIDPSLPFLPEPRIPPAGTLGPIAALPDSVPLPSGLCCRDDYCYFLNNYNVWVGEYFGAALPAEYQLCGTMLQAFERCCQALSSGNSCEYGSYPGNDSCDCGYFTDSGGGSCAPRPPLLPRIPANFPIPGTPPGGAPVPPPQTSSFSTCDYFYCYSLSGGEWSSTLRAPVESPPPPNRPAPDTVVPPPSPYAPVNYCDLYYCYYLFNSDFGYWGTIFRYGSQLIEAKPLSSTYYCDVHHCYSMSIDTGIWTASAIDPGLAFASALPAPRKPPTGFPGPIATRPETLPPQGMCCEGDYCYKLNDYKVWVAAYIGNDPVPPATPLCTTPDPLEECCVNHVAGPGSTCTSYNGVSCTCTDQGPPREVSCAVPDPPGLPPAFPPPNVPPPGAQVPSAPAAVANLCDYQFCYTYSGGAWSAQPRSTYLFPSTPNLPIGGPADPESPFYPYEYCDRVYCYGKTEGGFWFPMLRYGSELTEPAPFTPTSFCGLHHCFTLQGTAWVMRQIDLNAIGVPGELQPPESLPAPRNNPNALPPPEGQCLDENYVYAPNHYGVWVARVKTASDVGSLCSHGAENDYNTCCWTQTDNVGCTYSGASDGCICQSIFTACPERPPLPTIPPGAPPPSVIAPGSPVPPVQPVDASYCDYFYCYTYSASWSSILRVPGGSPPPPNPPGMALTPPDPATPYRPDLNINYCDLHYCYFVTENLYWGAVHRYGSELTSPGLWSATHFCGLHHCFTRTEIGDWEISLIDPNAGGLPAVGIPVSTAPAPRPISPSAQPPPEGKCLDNDYSYARNHYGIWGANVKAAGEVGPLCVNVIPGWSTPEEDETRCCTTHTSNLTCTYEAANDACNCGTGPFSCAPPTPGPPPL